MSKPTTVIALCEDYRTFSLLRRYLGRCRIDSRNIRPVFTPSGSGFDWVINQYPVQVNAYRLAKAKIAPWLIVAVDADNGPKERRIGQLATKLKEAEDSGQTKVTVANEAIAHLVPKRNIETWILALNRIGVNETENYKETRRNEDWDGRIPAAAEALYDWTRRNANLPDGLIDSLRHGIQELNRLPVAFR